MSYVERESATLAGYGGDDALGKLSLKKVNLKTVVKPAAKVLKPVTRTAAKVVPHVPVIGAPVKAAVAVGGAVGKAAKKKAAPKKQPRQVAPAAEITAATRAEKPKRRGNVLQRAARRVGRATGRGGNSTADQVREQAAIGADVVEAGGKVRRRANGGAERLYRLGRKGRDVADRARRIGEAAGLESQGTAVAAAVTTAAQSVDAGADGLRIAGAAVQGAATGAAGGAAAEGTRQSVAEFVSSPLGIAAVFGGGFMVMKLLGDGRQGGRRA